MKFQRAFSWLLRILDKLSEFSVEIDFG